MFGDANKRVKRYNPINSTLRRYVFLIQKTIYVLVVFGIYSFTIHPLLEPTTNEAVLFATSLSSRQLASDIELRPIPLDSSELPNDIYAVSRSVNDSGVLGAQSPNLVTTDPRVIAMRNFLRDYNSPMYPYAEIIVSEADKYGLDWRLVIAISGVESAFGLYIPPYSYNAWGWKGDKSQVNSWSHFGSWGVGIKTVTERLALGYGTNLTPFDIEATYCPPCGQTPGNPWANGVTRFMSELTFYVENV